MGDTYSYFPVQQSFIETEMCHKNFQFFLSMKYDPPRCLLATSTTHAFEEKACHLFRINEPPHGKTNEGLGLGLGLGENKGADQLRSNCEADQRLCFRYTESTIPLLSKSKIYSL